MSEYLDTMDEDFSEVVSSFEARLVTVRTGRATPQLIENVSIDVVSYGAKLPLNQLATITAPDARMLVVNAWDKGSVSDIERGIRSAGLGLNPNNDGQLIRVPIPPLTGERRQSLVKQVRQYAEDARVRGRKVRKEYNDLVKELETEKEISEDESKSLQKLVQTATDSCMKQIDTICQSKEAEVMEV